MSKGSLGLSKSQATGSGALMGSRMGQRGWMSLLSVGVYSGYLNLQMPLCPDIEYESRSIPEGH